MSKLPTIFATLRSNLSFVVVIPVFWLSFVLLYQPSKLLDLLNMGDSMLNFNTTIIMCILLGVMIISRGVLMAIHHTLQLNWFKFMVWEVAEVMTNVMCEDYGNPSSMHLKGVEGEKYIRQAKEIIAKNLKVSEKEIFFTSGGTESDNLAIIGTAMANRRRGNHLITTMIEHPAVLMCFEKLEQEGYEVTYLDVDENGIIDMDQLRNSITDKTIFISVMAVNNEMGSIQPINEIAKLKKKYNFIMLK